MKYHVIRVDSTTPSWAIETQGLHVATFNNFDDAEERCREESTKLQRSMEDYPELSVPYRYVVEEEEQQDSSYYEEWCSHCGANVPVGMCDHEL